MSRTVFYADEEVLEFMELELITYTAIARDDFRISNHLGDLRRLGLSVEEIGQVTECGELGWRKGLAVSEGYGGGIGEKTPRGAKTLRLRKEL